MRHTKIKILPFVFASGLLASSLAQAAQLGKLEVLSGAGEPFLAEIQIDLLSPEERSTLQARLGSADAFKAARLTMDPNLKNLQFAILDGKQPGTAVVKITAAQPMPAGFIDTLVELTWAGGRVAREYTLTIPVGSSPPKPEQTTSLPEIRPPMTPPPALSPSKPLAEPKADTVVEQPRPAVDAGGLQVQRGDTLSELALRLVGDGVTLNQAMAALYEANKESFINGSVHLIREGAQIQLPNRAALRSKTANEALLILAQNDDRNVYSAFARQIGLLTVENQTAVTSSTSAQGNIAVQAKPDAAVVPRADRLQIAPGSAQGTSNTDVNAEELVAKNKALAEANERIALLEKNVSDLQRLLDMQKDLGETPVEAPVGVQSEEGAEPSPESESSEPAPLDVTSKTLDETVEGEVAQVTPEAEEGLEAPVAEVPQEDAPFDWMPWILAGAGGLVALVVWLLLVRARRNKAEKDNDEFDAEEESSFSEVHEFDEAITAAGTGIAAEQAGNLNQAENSEFDLDEVLNDRLKQVESTDLDDVPPAAVDPVLIDEPEVQAMPEFNDASEESLQQTESLDSEVTLDFPDDEPPVVAASNSILDDLDDLEKATLSAQEELDEIRKHPPVSTEDEELDASFDDLLETADEVKVEVPVEEETVDLDVDVPTPKVDDATWQEVATKLDLAGAYVEIGDADGAKELLNEIVKKGDPDQVQKAKALLTTLR